MKPLGEPGKDHDRSANSTTIPMWRRYLRFWGPEPAADIDDEIAFHIQATMDELIATGIAPDEARRQAEQRFGPQREVRNTCRAIGEGQVQSRARVEWFTGLWRDITYSLRVLWKARLSTLSAIAILAVATGASTAVFTVLDATIYKPLPVANAEKLLHITQSFQPGDPDRAATIDAPLSYIGFQFLRANSRSFEHLGALATLYNREALSEEEIFNGVTPGQAQLVTGNYFTLLGVEPLLGRLLQPFDDQPGAYNVAAISYEFWAERYAADPEVIGQTLFLEGQEDRAVPFTIIGVLPASFYGIQKNGDVEIKIPLAATAELYPPQMMQNPGSRTMRTVGILTEGTNREEAEAELAVLWEQYTASDIVMAQDKAFRPLPDSALLKIEDLSSGLASLTGERRQSVNLVAQVIGLTLLIGCVNVACLLTARNARRRREIAIRFALGASRWCVVRQGLVEVMILASMGGALGILITMVGQRLLLAGLNWNNGAVDLSPDVRVLTFGVAVVCGSALFCGLVPLLPFLKRAQNHLDQDLRLKPFSSGRILVAAEIALSLVLVAGAGMFIRGVQNLSSVPVGFDAEGVAVLAFSPSTPMFGADREPVEIVASLAADVSELRRELLTDGALPELAVANSMPFGDAAIVYQVEGSERSARAYWLRIDENYFDVLGIGMRAGRQFQLTDDAGGEPVVILSGTLADSLTDGGESGDDLVGQFIDMGTLHARVVGIAGDIKAHNLRSPEASLIYQPLQQPQPGGGYMGNINLYARTERPLGDLEALAHQHLEAGRFDMSLSRSVLLEDAIGASYQNDRIRMQATSIFAVMALVLIAAGIYGLMAYAVAQRSREIGVRMAVGATSEKIVGLILRDSLKLVVIGVLLGIPLALAAMRVLAAYVFELSPTDPYSLGGAIALMLITATIAAAGPALRASRIDPVETLRAE